MPPKLLADACPLIVPPKLLGDAWPLIVPPKLLPDACPLFVPLICLPMRGPPHVAPQGVAPNRGAELLPSGPGACFPPAHGWQPSRRPYLNVVHVWGHRMVLCTLSTL